MGPSGPRPSTRLAPALKAFSTTLLTVVGNSRPHWSDSDGIRWASAISRPSAQYRRGVWSARFRTGEYVSLVTARAARTAKPPPYAHGSARKPSRQLRK